MSCASVNCKGKNVSQTLRNRCCGKSVGKCAGLTGETLKQCQADKSTLFKPPGGGKSIAQRVQEGEGQNEDRPDSVVDKVSKGEFGNGTGTTDKPDEEYKGNSDLAPHDQDCANFWGFGGLLDGFCTATKGAQKANNDCMGLGIQCGHLAIGVLAAVLLLVVLPKIL